MIDMEFASGVNLPVIHTSVHQPLDDDKKPGLSLAIFGQYFNRNETWAGMARPWVDYMARSAFLLQQGRFYADVAYFYGEEAPLVSLYKTGQPADAPRRYAYDFVNADALRSKLSVRTATWWRKSGARYRVLFLGGASHRMTLATLRRLHALAAQGATIVGRRRSPRPAWPTIRAQFARWSSACGAARPRPGSARAGRRRPRRGGGAGTLGQAPDVEFAAPATRAAVRAPPPEGWRPVFRRQPRGKAVATEARFNVRGKAADLWHADTGRAEPASYRSEGKRTACRWRWARTSRSSSCSAGRPPRRP
jgi:hypothetical protein